MSKVLQRLTDDHEDFKAFLGALDHQIGRLERGGEVDYEILRGVSSYFKDFADPVHHPLEDAVLERLEKRAPEAAAKVAKVADDHDRLASELTVFSNAVAAILNEEEVPRDQVIDVIRRFIADQRAHMQAEDTLFFPLALDHLSDADWLEVEAVMERQMADPGIPNPEAYAALRAHLATV